MKKERKIGDKWVLGESTFQCVEDVDKKRCTRCSFSSAQYDDACSETACMISDRKDGKLVIVKKL